MEILIKYIIKYANNGPFNESYTSVIILIHHHPIPLRYTVQMQPVVMQSPVLVESNKVKYKIISYNFLRYIHNIRMIYL